MEREKLLEQLTKAVEEYCLDEEIYGDDPYLEINPDGGLRLISGDDADDSPFDCYSVLDLVEPSKAHPDKFQPNPEAISDLTDQLL
ncbi:MAG: hypothetical protein J6C81_05245 [Muribaculaceae bacterium]|nr:hypothetical protein [Muribaculaceae bacterium]